MFRSSWRRGVALSILLIAATNVGCGSDRDLSGPPAASSTGAIALWLDLARDSVEQAGQRTNTVRVLRSGGYQQHVDFSVSGVPVGVVVMITDVHTSGTITLATIIVTVDPAAPPGVYPLVVHARGTGVEEVTAPYQLTVQTPRVPGYLIAFAASSAMHIVKEYRNASVRLNLSRRNFLGKVVLTAENLPTGVTAEFMPDSAESSSLLILTAADSAPLGTFNDLIVRGIAPGLEDRTVPLSLTISSRGFAFTLGAQALTIDRGSAATLDIQVLRTTYHGAVSFLAAGLYGDDHESLPAGVTVSFEPASSNGAGTTLTVRVSQSANPGTYFIYVWGEGLPSLWFAAPPLILVIKAT